MLKNSMQYDKTVVNHHRLLRLIELGNDMYDAKSLNKLLKRAEAGLREIMLSEKGVIYLLDESKDQMFRADKEGGLEYFDLGCGVVGKVIRTGELYDIRTPCSDYDYNLASDLDTTLPVLAMPIRNPKSKRRVGALEVLNIKGIGNMTTGKADILELEAIRLFCEQVAICVDRFIKYQSTTEQQEDEICVPRSKSRSFLGEIKKHKGSVSLRDMLTDNPSTEQKPEDPPLSDSSDIQEEETD